MPRFDIFGHVQTKRNEIDLTSWKINLSKVKNTSDEIVINAKNILKYIFWKNTKPYDLQEYG